MKKLNLEYYLAFLAVVLGAVFMRLIPHIPNVAPIGALALFSGFLMPNITGFLLPLIAMVISDRFLGFHSTILYVYGSFILITGIGYFLHKKITLLRVGIGSLSGSSLFFIITNFGVWATSSMYEKNIGGLLKSYMMGLPFFRNTLVGDLFYNIVFFVGYGIFLVVSKQIVITVKRLVHYHLS